MKYRDGMTSPHKLHLSARGDYFTELAETKNDFVASLMRWQLSLSLALHDISARYRGSILGPWWITITMGVLILGIGLNYAALFHLPVNQFLPYVALGIVFWQFLSSCIAEGGEAFTAGAAMLRQTSLPLPVFLLRVLLRGIINLGHHIVIVILVLVYFGYFPSSIMGLGWSIVGLIIDLLNLAWVMLLLAFFSARFRDVPQIIASILQIAFFLTPIFWKVTPAMVHSPLVVWNPFYYLIDAIRGPLLGYPARPSTYAMLAGAALIGWIFSIAIYNQTRRRIVHYL